MGLVVDVGAGVRVARDGEAVQGCGGLLLILIVIVGVVSSCLGGGEDNDAPRLNRTAKG